MKTKILLLLLSAFLLSSCYFSTQKPQPPLKAAALEESSNYLFKTKEGTFYCSVSQEGKISAFKVGDNGSLNPYPVKTHRLPLAHWAYSPDFK